MRSREYKDLANGTCFRCASPTSYIEKLGSFLCEECYTDDIDFCSHPRCVGQAIRLVGICPGTHDDDAPNMRRVVRCEGAIDHDEYERLKSEIKQLRDENATLRAEVASLNSKIDDLKSLNVTAQLPKVDVEREMAAKLMHYYLPKRAQKLITLIPEYMKRQDVVFAEQKARGAACYMSQELLVSPGLSAKDVENLYAVECEVLKEHGLIDTPANTQHATLPEDSEQQHIFEFWMNKPGKDTLI